MLGRFPRLLHGDLQFRPSHSDAVAVLEGDLRVTTFGACFRGLAHFARSEFLSVDPGAVQAAEIAQARRRWVRFKDEMMPGDLSVVGDARVAVVHASENEGIVLRKGKEFSGILACGDLDLDFGAHGFWGHYEARAKSSTSRLVPSRGLQKTLGIDAGKTAGFQLFTQALQGGMTNLMDGLFADAQFRSNVAVALPFPELDDDRPRTGREFPKHVIQNPARFRGPRRQGHIGAGIGVVFARRGGCRFRGRRLRVEREIVDLHIAKLPREKAVERYMKKRFGLTVSLSEHARITGTL